MKATPNEQFAPRIYADQMGSWYADGSVLGGIDTATASNGARTLVISEWTSFSKGCGNTTRALRWLRSQGFSHIVANGVGTVEDGAPDNTVRYWLHMQRKGLVDTLLDDEHNRVSLSDTGAPSES